MQDCDDINRAVGSRIAEGIKPRTIEACATLPLIPIDVGRTQAVLVGLHPLLEHR
jgi:hypothetical protein